jgi:hypothetical protein
VPPILLAQMRALTVRWSGALRRAIAVRRLPAVLSALLLGVAVVVVTIAAGHVELLHRMPIFSGAQAISGVTEFLNSIKGYLLSIVLAGFTVAGIAVGAAKLTGHTRANDMIFNVGIGVAIFAALPTLVA